MAENNDQEWEKFYEFAFGVAISLPKEEERPMKPIRTLDMVSRGTPEPISCNLTRWLE